MPFHKNETAGSIHIINQWAVADTTARDALSVVAGDVGKVCKVGSDPATFYILTDNSPMTWAQLASGGATIDQGRHTIWIPATAMVARTTNGAGAGSVELTTNKGMLKSLDFDTATAEYAQFDIRMPKSWNEGTVTASVAWTANSTSTNSVVWAIQGTALSNDETLDAAQGTAQTSTDANTATAYQLHLSPETSAITIAGTPAAEDWVKFQIYRDVSNGSDTLGVDAMLLGVTLYYTINAATDS